MTDDNKDLEWAVELVETEMPSLSSRQARDIVRTFAEPLRKSMRVEAVEREANRVLAEERDWAKQRIEELEIALALVRENLSWMLSNGYNSEVRADARDAIDATDASLPGAKVQPNTCCGHPFSAPNRKGKPSTFLCEKARDHEGLCGIPRKGYEANT